MVTPSKESLVKNEKLEAAKTFLKKAGQDDIPDETLLGLFEVIRDKRDAIYEEGDFIFYNEGMGEAGHGTVVRRAGNNYAVMTWTHDPKKFPSHPTVVPIGDVFRLSNEEEAMDYYLVRSGQK